MDEGHTHYELKEEKMAILVQNDDSLMHSTKKLWFLGAIKNACKEIDVSIVQEPTFLLSYVYNVTTKIIEYKTNMLIPKT